MQWCNRRCNPAMTRGFYRHSECFLSRCVDVLFGGMRIACYKELVLRRVILSRWDSWGRTMRMHRGAWVCVVVFGLLLHGATFGGGSEAAEPRGPSVRQQVFDHGRTTFPLTGRHKTLDCEACHAGGRYENLPTECGSCHKLPQKHVVDQRTSLGMGGCTACHSTNDWTGASFSHLPALTAGKCDTCHNGRTAMGKPASHLATTAQCDQCHTTTSFAGGTFRHDPATTAGRCDTCHNGRTATGKPAGHLTTTAQCDTCHRTTGWTPASYANHMNPQLIGAHSPLDCRVCHPQSFSTAFFRDGVQYGFCSNCHRRDYRYPGPDEHRSKGTNFESSLQINANCAACHRHAGYREF